MGSRRSGNKTAHRLFAAMISEEMENPASLWLYPDRIKSQTAGFLFFAHRFCSFTLTNLVGGYRIYLSYWLCCLQHGDNHSPITDGRSSPPLRCPASSAADAPATDSPVKNHLACSSPGAASPRFTISAPVSKWHETAIPPQTRITVRLSAHANKGISHNPTIREYFAERC